MDLLNTLETEGNVSVSLMPCSNYMTYLKIKISFIYFTLFLPREAAMLARSWGS